MEEILPKVKPTVLAVDHPTVGAVFPHGECLGFTLGWVNGALPNPAERTTARQSIGTAVYKKFTNASAAQKAKAKRFRAVCSGKSPLYSVLRAQIIRTVHLELSSTVGKGERMNNRNAVVFGLVFCVVAVLIAVPSLASAQAPEAAKKLEALAKQLNLTPEQKGKILPILEEEAPKLKAIKADTTSTNMQKLEKVRTIHQ
jgi:hypothetical protein